MPTWAHLIRFFPGLDLKVYWAVAGEGVKETLIPWSSEEARLEKQHVHRRDQHSCIYLATAILDFPKYWNGAGVQQCLTLEGLQLVMASWQCQSGAVRDLGRASTLGTPPFGGLEPSLVLSCRT